MKIKKTINRLLDELENSTIVTLTCRTPVEILKKSRIDKSILCPYEKMFKFSMMNGIIGCSYESVVNKQLGREGKDETFVAKELWKGAGEHVEGDRFRIRHVPSGRLYLAFKVSSVLMELLQDEEGNNLNAEELVDFLPVKRDYSTKLTAKPIVWRVIALENIESIVYNGDNWYGTGS